NQGIDDVASQFDRFRKHPRNLVDESPSANRRVLKVVQPRITRIARMGLDRMDKVSWVEWDPESENLRFLDCACFHLIGEIRVIRGSFQLNSNGKARCPRFADSQG